MDDLQPEHEKGRSRIIYHPKAVLLMLSGLLFLCWFAGGSILALITRMQGLDLQDAVAGFGSDQTLDERNFMRGALLINHTATFLLPALLTGWLFFREKWPQHFSLNNRVKLSTLGLSVLFMMAAFPIAQVAFTANSWIVQQFPSLNSMVETETATENLLEGLLVMQSPWEMLFSLLVMAIVPALGEEMVFRGIVQQQLEKWKNRPLLAIGLTALLFSIVHFQIQRFLAILWLGLVLGLLLYWTRNLWVTIAAHFLNNGAQVVIAYFNQDQLKKVSEGPAEDLPLSVILVSAGLLVLAGIQLWHIRQASNDTSLAEP